MLLFASVSLIPNLLQYGSYSPYCYSEMSCSAWVTFIKAKITLSTYSKERNNWKKDTKKALLSSRTHPIQVCLCPMLKPSFQSIKFRGRRRSISRYARSVSETGWSCSLFVHCVLNIAWFLVHYFEGILLVFSFKCNKCIANVIQILYIFISIDRQ